MAGCRLYELRTYSLRLEQVRAFLRGTEERFHLRTKHSAVLGYWTAELGGLNQVVHVWEYDSLAHRAAVRAKMAEDPEWAAQYVAPILNPAIVAQENLLMRPIDGTTVTKPTTKGVSELQRYTLSGPERRWRPALQTFAARAAAAAGPGSSLIGCFHSLVGPLNTSVLLWHHPTQDDLLAAAERLHRLPEYEALQEHVHTSHNKMLLPHPVSPIQ